MKVRAAYGESGLLPGRLDGIPLLWEAEPAGYGAGATLSNIGDKKIKPERIKELEFGIEAEIFRNYSVELTYYQQKADDSIVDFLNAPSTGKIASAVPFNIGRIEGWGIESMIQARPISIRNFELDLSITNNYQTNEIKDLGGAQPIYDGFDVNVYKEGLPKHAFYVLQSKGALFNEDGSYDTPELENDGDRVFCGTPVPEYTGSFSLNLRIFRNFRVNCLAEWATEVSMYNNTKLFGIYLGSAFGIGANVKRYRELQDLLGLDDYDWYDNIDPLTVGSASYNDAAHEYARMDRRYDGNFIEEADWFKIREISVSYSFKDLIPKVLGTPLITDFVLGVSARNVWTTTKYTGADIELNFAGSRSLSRGQDFLTLMQPRVYNAWLRVSL